MREVRGSGAEIQGRYPDRRKTGHIGPTQLRPWWVPHRLDETLRRGRTQAWHGSGRAVPELDVEAAEHLADVRFGVGLAAIRRKPEVHHNLAQVGDDVARDASGDAHGVEALAVQAAVDVDLARLVAGQTRQHLARAVDRVHAQPGTGRMCPPANDFHARPQAALATRLDEAE